MPAPETLVTAVRQDDVGHRAAFRFRHVAEIRRAVGQHDHLALVACFSGYRNPGLCIGARRRYCGGFRCGAQTEFTLGLRVDGARHARYLGAELCPWSNSGARLFVESLLAAAFALGWFPES